jgi:plasmid rolling circle replication initiator protein Rep
MCGKLNASLNLDKKHLTSELGKAQQASNPKRTKKLTKQQLTKRAQRKAISIAQIDRLLELDSTIHSQYERTSRCNEYLFKYNHLTTNEHKFTANYCGKRWCPTCASKKTADMLSGYEHVFDQMVDPQFVTLTIVAVTEPHLKQSISRLPKTFALCKDAMRKSGYNLVGIRKIESEYNARKQTFNPHFHLIIDGRDNAIELVVQWLKHNPSTNRRAQKIKQADKGTLKELFKYTTKQVSGKRNIEFHARAQDAIYRALQGVRTFQSFGKIKKHKAPIDPIEQEQQSFNNWVKVDSYKWDRERNNWFNPQGKTIYAVRLKTSTKAIVTIIEHASD